MQSNYQICSNCGARKEDIKLLERTFKCDHCSLVIGRDLNSAINILKIG
ncbi:MAG: zinc ribbon domain-containing protein, partial [Caldisericum sp.]